MRYILAGTGMVFRTPRLWRYIAQPLAIAAAGFVAIALAAYFLAVPALDEWIRSWAGDSRIAAVLSVGLFAWLAISLSGFLYLTLVSLLSASMWEKLSLEIERLTAGNTVQAKLPAKVVWADAILRGLYALAIMLASVCIGWTFYGLPAILLAGWIGLYDYTAPALMRRGITAERQRAYVRRLPGRMGFVVAGGLLTLLPIVNLLMLPCLVAGGTLMVAEAERRGWGFPDAPR